MRTLFMIFLLLISGSISAQNTCATLIAPADGETDVPLDALLTWNAVEGINGYLLRIGTTPGGEDILREQLVGSTTTYRVPTGLPPGTTIYVRISLFFFNAESIACEEQEFTTEALSEIPECIVVSTPADGSTAVPTTPVISWDYSYGASGYIIRTGTSPGGNDLGEEDVGNVLEWTYPGILPSETLIYITVTPYNALGQASGCEETTFITRDAGPLPGCTRLTSPLNGAINVELSPPISWEAVPLATGYLVTMGYTPGASDILDNGFFETPSTRVIEFLPNSTIFVSIIPVNDAGEAVGCVSEYFSTTAGCGPFLDPETGNLIDLNPPIAISDTLLLCGEEDIYTLPDPDPDIVYSWYRVEDDNTEDFLGSGAALPDNGPGNYRVEATRVVSLENMVLDCTTEKEFTLLISSPPVLESATFTPAAAGVRITVNVSGPGNYRYALSEDGPFQSNPEFETTLASEYVLYIEDLSGCGISAFPLNPLAFPAFFSPNGDMINDLWQPLILSNEVRLQSLSIYDRYGRLLWIQPPEGGGWDGTYNGQPLPATDYWYDAIFTDGTRKKGHFSLRR